MEALRVIKIVVAYQCWLSQIYWLSIVTAEKRHSQRGGLGIRDL